MCCRVSWNCQWSADGSAQPPPTQVIPSAPYYQNLASSAQYRQWSLLPHILISSTVSPTKKEKLENFLTSTLNSASIGFLRTWSVYMHLHFHFQGMTRSSPKLHKSILNIIKVQLYNIYSYEKNQTIVIIPKSKRKIQKVIYTIRVTILKHSCTLFIPEVLFYWVNEREWLN